MQKKTESMTADTPKASGNPAQVEDDQAKAEQAKKDKQALIAAAIERAKAQKLAAAQAGIAPKNVEDASPAVKAEISEIDAIREKAKQAVKAKDSDAEA